MHFFIHNSIHAGDVILTRPVIKTIRESFPEVEITLECTEANKYLWEDMGLPVVAFEGGTHKHSTEPTPNCPPGAVFINMWFGAYRDILLTHYISYANNVHSFNRRMEEKGLQHLYRLKAPEYPPALEFYTKPQLPVKIAENGVLVENGPILSGQSRFPINDYLQQLSCTFPGLVFYCSAAPPLKASNLVDCSKLNLLQLSELSNRCKGFLTRGSGVNAVTYTEPNRFKPRCFVGMSRRGCRIWRDERNPPVEARDIVGVLSFLQTLDGKPSDLPRGALGGMCKFLKFESEIDRCTDYLKQTGYASHSLPCKNWEIAHIISVLSDGNLLDMGSTDSFILKNALVKGVKGEKYGVDLRAPNASSGAIKYITGDLHSVPMPDSHFKNITCLSVIEHGVELERFAKEASRLLSPGGRLYISFDYWVPKINPNTTLYGLKWEPLDNGDVMRLVSYCEKYKLRLDGNIDWSLGEKVIRPGYYSPRTGISYTFGMLVFKKCV